jgi:hypothetical protein
MRKAARYVPISTAARSALTAAVHSVAMLIVATLIVHSETCWQRDVYIKSGTHSLLHCKAVCTRSLSVITVHSSFIL